MNHRTLNNPHDDRKEIKPPYSKIFIVCSKELREEDLHAPFEKFGAIEDLYVPKDRTTGESKGVAYIKYQKTSSAAMAIQTMHQAVIPNSSKPLKVMVSANRSDNTDNSTDKCNRLFIKIHKQATEAEIKEHFIEFGNVEAVIIQKDKSTYESKGLAYVIFESFLDAARAFEECDKKYKAVFATPKLDLKRSRDSYDFHNDSSRSCNSSIRKNSYNDYYTDARDSLNVNSLIRTNPQNFDSVCATCTPAVPQKHMEKLFNIVPGMLQCQYTVDNYNGFCRAVISYEDERAAAYAVERLHNFEYPSGEIVTVKPNNPLSKAASDLTSMVNSFKNAVDVGNPDLVQLANAIAQASTLIKVAASGKVDSKSDLEANFNIKQEMNYCNVALPPPQPMASPGSTVARRCFIVGKPHPPPKDVLMDIFRRFGDLIEVSTFPNKTFGFVKYASMKAAQEAINTLNGASVCGCHLKVIEADEKPTKDKDRSTHMDTDLENLHTDSDSDRKRMKFHD